MLFNFDTINNYKLCEKYGEAKEREFTSIQGKNCLSCKNQKLIKFIVNYMWKGIYHNRQTISFKNIIHKKNFSNPSGDFGVGFF